MNYDNYNSKFLVQYQNAAEVYAKRIFIPITRIDCVQSLATQEHLRIPPMNGLSEIKSGTNWGGRWQNLWLSVDLKLDKRFTGKQIWLIPYTGAVEVMCFKNGTPYGLINSKNDFIAGKHSAFYVMNGTGNDNVHVDMECYAGHFCPGEHPYDNYGSDTPNENDYIRRFDGIDICIMDEDVNRMVFDLSCVLQLAQLPATNYICGKALRALTEAFPYFIQDPLQHTLEEIDEAARKVSAILRKALEKSEYNDGSRGNIALIGHSHMDTAWLWPYSETIRKCARTYSEVMSLMDRYPDYGFIQSSALHLYWMEKYYPALFEMMNQRIAEGRYEPNGGVWVECDCNITGGEAMVRQFLYGQRYTREKFNYTSDCFWLPDTFGYNAAIPQIMRKTGVKYFLTTKIEWNDLNQMETDTFRWRGLDGSEVLTHFNKMQAIPDPLTITEHAETIRDKSTADSKLVCYGFGDGGGGPTYGMLEYADRVKGLPGMPKVETTTVSAFMDKLDENREQYPVYDGELYLEFHRGTLTSIHDVKRNNRKAEIAMHNMEFLNVLSGEKKHPDTEYLYKELLRNQFHDILPGSSIGEVNDTARKEVTAVINAANEHAQTYIGKTKNGNYALTNASSFDWNETDVIEADGNLPIENAQHYTDAFGRERTAFTGIHVPAYSVVPFSGKTTAKKAEPFCYTGDVLTTHFFKVCFNAEGYITSLIDKETGREFVRSTDKPLGMLYIGENMPWKYENWEISPSMELKYNEVHKLLSRELVTNGAVELRIRSVYAISEKTTVTVDTVFHASDRRIDYQLKVDWHEKRKLMKIGFDVDVTSKFVRNEIQFGNMERPTTRNTSLDTAKYEVVNHKWSDLSDTRGGVALLNDCKYGMSAKGTDLRLTLMHGGMRPDTRGDEGVHEMNLAILPHVGSFNTENVIAPAYKFNMPLLITEAKSGDKQLFTLHSSHVICETVKYAEDIDNAYVLRLYECEGTPEKCSIDLGDIISVTESNMLEEDENSIAYENGTAALSFRPFEIKTLIVRMK